VGTLCVCLSSVSSHRPRLKIFADSVRVCMQKGQIPRINSAQDPTQRQSILDKIAPWLALKLRCQGIVGRCSEAVIENGIQVMSMDQERALDILLRTYESQIDDIELQAVTGKITIWLQVMVFPADPDLKMTRGLMSSLPAWLSKPTTSTRSRHGSRVHVPHESSSQHAT
jgi:hypothetical protein